jgi:hypothetical protein
MVVGLSLPWKNAEYVEITSKRSLADGDVIVFCPTILTEFFTSEKYLGDPCFDDDTSFQIRQCMSHWRTEATAALSAGKTLIVILGEEEKFHLGTGRREYSGTGRNRHETRMVASATNYGMLPYTIQNLSNASGNKIKRESRLWPIESYWQIMESLSHYSVTYTVGEAVPLLKTADNTRVVASALQVHGYFVLVPDIIFPDDLENEDEADEDGQPLWTPQAEEFSKRLEAAFFALDTERHDANAKTQPPEWLSSDAYRLAGEEKIENEIQQLSNSIEELQTEHQKKTLELDQYLKPKGLLYEKGAPLEDAVIAALRELGFDASPYRTAENEFDVVFQADGTRYLGEIEGRDDKAIHVDKISQLERNIQEDFERDDVSEHAVGVLFGNAFRLIEVEKRDASFTEKVGKAASRSGIRLVNTADLFRAIQKLRSTNDSKKFAERCRRALRDQKGKLVDFPDK